MTKLTDAFCGHGSAPNDQMQETHREKKPYSLHRRQTRKRGYSPHRRRIKGKNMKMTEQTNLLLLLLLFISNQIEEIQSIYNLICCRVLVSWKGDHPTMSPQSCRSEVQRLFSLLLLIGCVSVSNSGLGWDSNLLRCLILSLMTSLT